MENSIQKGLSRLQILIMAITAGVSVASLYYVQPILDEVSKSLHKSENEVGLLPALAQAGYGLGLFFITPYGDKMNRKKLILLMLFVLVLALFGMALIHNLYGIYVMSLIIGAMGAAAQVVMPMAATLATENKGKIVGMVFTGLLSGILLARVVSGYSARLWGWQSIYMISAFVIMIMMVLVYFTLPNVGTQFSGTYGELLKSTIAQYKRFPKLRRLSIIGALVFGVFAHSGLQLHFTLPENHFF
nr:MFS transporter [Elizabethkingia bruuniana]